MLELLFGSSGVTIILIAILMKYKQNPELFYKMMYNIMYYFSVCQIKFKKLYTYIDTNFLQLIQDKDTSKIKVQYYINGKLQMSETIKERKVIDSSFTKFDLLIVSENGLSRVITRSSSFNIGSVVETKESKTKFIALTVSYNGEKYPIYLKEDNYNYYVINNVIDKSFLQFYLVNVLNLDIDINNFSYELEIIDNDVNIQVIDDVKHVILNEDGYTIV